MFRRFNGTGRPPRAAAAAQRFEALIRPHVAQLYATAYRYTRRREDAEDLVQDLLTKLYPRTAELERIDDLRPWLARALYHAFVDATRKRRRTPQGSDDVSEAETATDQGPQHDVVRHEQRRALNAAIERLSPDHRAVVILHLVEGYSLPELEGMLGIQLGTLKSRLHRAKAQLREALDTAEPFHSTERVVGHELH